MSAVLFLSLIAHSNAHAQVAGGIAIESDYRLRGFTLSAGHPVATVKTSYDDTSGVYASATASAVLNSDNVRFLGWQAGLGFARRTKGRTTVDAGVVHTQYRAAYPQGRDYHYTEVYLGVIRDPVQARVSYSPNYFRSDQHTIYGEIEATLPVTDTLAVNTHGGVLTFVSAPGLASFAHKTFYDWSVGASQRLGDLEVHAAISGGGPGKQRYEGALHSRSRLTAGASWSF